MQAILAPHQRRTVQRMKAQPTVLCVQDATELNYSGLVQCAGLGVIGSNQTGAQSGGLHLHSTLVLTTQGLPLAVTSAADAAGAAGVQPVTTFGYTAYTAAGFPAFTLQTSASQKSSASNTVLSTTAYNAANQYVPQTVMADAGTGKLNITSTLTFDAVGNPTQVNGPRPDVTGTVTTAYDGERRSSRATAGLRP